MKKNILITGGAGYIGSCVANLLIDKGYKVTIIDNLITGNKFLIPKKAKFINCDISNEKKIDSVLKKTFFSAVLHFAGLIRVDESVKKPKKYLKYNFIKAKKFFDICFKNNLKKIIFSSTASVYGNQRGIIRKVKETSKLMPQNPYAISKLKLEKYLMDRKKNINYVILRYFNVVGAEKRLRSGQVSKYSTHLLKKICETVIGKQDYLTIHGINYNTKDGTAVRDYIDINDLSFMHLIALEYLIKNNINDVFNCGYGKGFSVKDMVNSASKVINKKIKVRFGPRRQGDPEYIVANSNKFKKFFSWKPKYNELNTIIKSALKWEKKISFKMVKEKSKHK